jgi:hypothetical protein
MAGEWTAMERQFGSIKGTQNAPATRDRLSEKHCAATIIWLRYWWPRQDSNLRHKV